MFTHQLPATQWKQSLQAHNYVDGEEQKKRLQKQENPRQPSTLG